MRLVGIGRKHSVKISLLVLAVSFQSLSVSSARGSATISSSTVPTSSSLAIGAARMKLVTRSPLSHHCGSMRPRCSKFTMKRINMAQGVVFCGIVGHTAVEFATKGSCKASCHVRLTVHPCLKEVLILNHQADLGIAITL